MQYRADIDGLRAIAVIAVILNHLPGQYLPGGFLGVDVFFVISGFVVTASIANAEMRSFSSFYGQFLARRINRLWPALLACVAITSTAVVFVDPFPKESVITGIWALFGSSNIHLFTAQLDYFASSSKFNAFTHTWSLGVEEQFYLFYPLFCWVVVQTKVHQKRNVLLPLIAAISLLSFLLFIVFYDDNQPAAYYLMPMRLWELVVGAAAYLLYQSEWDAEEQRRLSTLSPLVLLGIGACFFIPEFHAATATPITVVLTALLLLNSRASVVGRFLSSQPLVYLGKSSYSLYLFHWPIISLAPLVIESQWRSPALYCAVIAATSFASYHFIELPFRTGKFRSRKLAVIPRAFAASACLAISTYLSLLLFEPTEAVKLDAGYPPPFLPLVGTNLPYNPTCVVDGLHRPLSKNTFDLCTVPAKTNSGLPTIWAEGDSHAGMLQGMLHELHFRAGLGIHLISTPGVPFPFNPQAQPFPPRNLIHTEILARAAPGDIVLVNRLYFERDPAVALAPDLKDWMERLSTLAATLSQREVALITVGPSPIFRFKDIRECDSAKYLDCAVPRSDFSQQSAVVVSMLKQLEQLNSNFFLLDPAVVLCPNSATFCSPMRDGQFIYRDRDHLNALGASMLAKPMLQLLHRQGLI